MVLERDWERCAKCGISNNLQVHHRRPRGKGGTLLRWVNQPANLITLCLTCHADVESHREQAKDMGYIIPQGIAQAREVKLWTWRGWVLLGNNGELIRCGGTRSHAW